MGTAPSSVCRCVSARVGCGRAASSHGAERHAEVGGRHVHYLFCKLITNKPRRGTARGGRDPAPAAGTGKARCARARGASGPRSGARSVFVSRHTQYKTHHKGPCPWPVGDSAVTRAGDVAPSSDPDRNRRRGRATAPRPHIGMPRGLVISGRATRAPRPAS